MKDHEPFDENRGDHSYPMDGSDWMLNEDPSGIPTLKNELSDLLYNFRSQEEEIKFLCQKIKELEKDKARLDKLDKLRNYYSRPPCRAVTGWQWTVINEDGTDNIRESIDRL